MDNFELKKYLAEGRLLKEEEKNLIMKSLEELPKAINQLIKYTNEKLKY